ncbi:MAG: hypothetical protein ACYTKD_20200 [Planctomycetota bacterium]|jgi:hypothetical protein
MLVIVSDLHLTDGTSGRTIGEDAFRILRKQLGNLSYAASWRADGSYRPIDEAHVVLLGDVLDVIRSTKWLESDTRPWDDPRGPEFDAKVAEITRGILTNNAGSLAVLSSISRGGEVEVPKHPPRGTTSTVEPEDAGPEREKVPVSIHYQVGNHDWFYHLAGPHYDKLRAEVKKAMGLANGPALPFPHDPSESEALSKVYEEHEVFARHGDVYDPFNYEKSRDASSLGDVIVVELLNRFPDEVRKQMSDVLPQDCLEGLEEIDNVRPLPLIPVWLHGLLERTCASKKLVNDVKRIWDGLADEFLKLKYVRDRDRWVPWDNVDKLEWALKFSKGVSLRSLGNVVSWVTDKVSRKKGLHKNALEEAPFLKRDARFVVYGHTHHFEIVPLDVSLKGEKRFDQMYVNAGTWRVVHEQAALCPADQEFVGYGVMTYVAFFREDERRGRRFESWSGALGAV